MPGGGPSGGGNRSIAAPSFPARSSTHLLSRQKHTLWLHTACLRTARVRPNALSLPPLHVCNHGGPDGVSHLSCGNLLTCNPLILELMAECHIVTSPTTGGPGSCSGAGPCGKGGALGTGSAASAFVLLGASSIASVLVRYLCGFPGGGKPSGLRVG